MKFSREWVMPDAQTFRMAPVSRLLARITEGRRAIVDPFARSSRMAHYANDLQPGWGHEFNMDARDFVALMAARGVVFDCVLFDPPYSPRQISECYQGVGRKVTAEDTQSAALYSEVRDVLSGQCASGAIAVSFEWNSVGFGKGRGWELEEVLLLCHGGAHNDTICVVERKTQGELFAAGVA